jgi:hypothetical protein
MIEFIHQNLNHVLFVLLLVSRVGDVASTLLATPKLKLEANPVARKLGKPFMFASLLIAFVAYLHTGLAVTALIPFLMVSASNVGKVALLKYTGETAYHDFVLNAIRKHGVGGFILGNVVSSLFVVLIGFVIFVLSPDPAEWGFWIGLGFFMYAFVIVLWGTTNYLRLARAVKRTATPGPSAADGEASA